MHLDVHIWICHIFMIGRKIAYQGSSRVCRPLVPQYRRFPRRKPVISFNRSQADSIIETDSITNVILVKFSVIIFYSVCFQPIVQNIRRHIFSLTLATNYDLNISSFLFEHLSYFHVSLSLDYRSSWSSSFLKFKIEHSHVELLNDI